MVLLFGASFCLEGNHPVNVVTVYPQSTLGRGHGLVVDDNGHMYAGYVVSDLGVAEAVVIIPDGVVGARVKDIEGVEKYFKKILV